MNAKLRKCLRASNVPSCKYMFSPLHVQACKLVLNRTCDSKGRLVIVQVLVISRSCALTNACLYAYVHVSVRLFV
jgi:hypothetical protein